MSLSRPTLTQRERERERERELERGRGEWPPGPVVVGEEEKEDSLDVPPSPLQASVLRDPSEWKDSL